MGDWVIDHMGWTLAGLAVIAAPLIWWAVVSMNAWEDGCLDKGGHVESRFIGFIHMQNGNTTTLVPNYSYHCMINGQEVMV